jgi:predicted lipoprotein with Yx(FWY)xxD motif
MRIRTLTGVTLAGATLLAACGSGGGSSPAAAPARHATKTATTPAATVTTRSTPLGKVLVDAQGRTLYAFTNDMNDTSSCTGACAQNWPPLTVAAGWTAGTGLDRATFHVVGTTMQLSTVKWPLYRYAGDSKPGDVNGEGVLGKWFAVAPDGSLVKSTGASTTSSASSATTAPPRSGSGY